jgi:predicted HTH transcriptional regulator
MAIIKFSRRTIDRAIAALKDKGILTREGAKNNATWVITQSQL